MGITHIIDSLKNITARVGGKIFNIPSDHSYYETLTAALKSGNQDEFLRYADMSDQIRNYLTEDVSVVGGVIYYKGNLVNNLVCDRIVEFIENSLPCMPLVRFLERLLQNPDPHSQAELFRFLENKNLPITDDGCFLAYKAINENWRDINSDTVDNRVGCRPRMERESCDADWRNSCSSGYHVGSICYVKGFRVANGHVMIVKVDPKDAISVPEYQTTKMRVCEYLVMEELMDVDAPLSELLYTTEGVTYSPHSTKPCAVAVADAQAVASQVTTADDEDEDDWDEDDDDWEDDEDDDYDDDDDDDDEDDWEDDEDEDEDEDESSSSFTITQTPAADIVIPPQKLSSLPDAKYSMIKDWAATIGISSDLIDQTDVGSFESIVQSLYTQCIKDNNTQAVSFLENKVYRNRLRDILS